MQTVETTDKAVRQWLDLLVRRWDEALLAGVALATLAMTGYLLWPQPETTITLHPLKATDVAKISSPSLSLDTADLNAESPDRPQPSARRTWRNSGPKKPKIPPVMNLNTATSAQLQLLPGIGPKMAERILETRKRLGRFASIEQILDVNGIGPKKFEKMKAYLRV